MKSCEMDTILIGLLKSILPLIIGDIADIINSSLEQGVFVCQWKIAIGN